MVEDCEARRPDEVDVSLSADEIAMLSVLATILVGSLALLIWIMGYGVDGVVGIFRRGE